MVPARSHDGLVVALTLQNRATLSAWSSQVSCSIANLQLGLAAIKGGSQNMSNLLGEYDSLHPGLHLAYISRRMHDIDPGPGDENPTSGLS
jgi:hypothetical protein